MTPTYEDLKRESDDRKRRQREHPRQLLTPTGERLVKCLHGCDLCVEQVDPFQL